jgi:hypothetical protein
MLNKKARRYVILNSVWDPDPHVFGPIGSDPDPLVSSTDPAPDPRIRILSFFS